MSKDIRIKKGFNIKLVGEAEKQTVQAIPSNVYAIQLSDFHGIVPKMLKKVGDKVQAGEAVFYNKTNEAMKFAAPVSGEVSEIIRGDRRRILTIKIKADKEQSYTSVASLNLDSANAEVVKNHLLSSGCWPFISQRPYAIIANPEVAPKAIFISAYASAPLAADYDYTLVGKEAELQAAVTALSKLTSGDVHVSVGKDSKSPLSGLKGVSLHKVQDHILQEMLVLKLTK
jgi:Na+-transporting NADH:ubiquinone oxidoreductase subunit A